MRSEHGQASIEWLGLVALVVALALGAAVLFSGDALAGAVLRQFHRALCVVSGGDCERDRAPCVRRSDRTDDEAHVNLGLLRIGRHEVVLLEERSDGTVAVTYVGDVDSGLEVGIGADLTVSSSLLNVSLGQSARAAALVRLGKGTTWVFPDARSADAGMAALSEHQIPPRGEVGERLVHSDLVLGLDAHGRTAKASGSLHLGAELVSGSVRGADGSVTHVLGTRGASSLLLGSSPGSLSGAGAGEETVTVTVDANGRAVDLGVVRSGELHGSASLPEAAQAVAGSVLAIKGARRWTVEQHLDLTDASNREAATGFLAAVKAGSPLARPGDALRQRLSERGLTDVRTYDLQETSGGVGAHVGIGGRFGGAITDRVTQARLLSALQRGPDGLWRTRTDCMPD